MDPSIVYRTFAPPVVVDMARITAPFCAAVVDKAGVATVTPPVLELFPAPLHPIAIPCSNTAPARKIERIFTSYDVLLNRDGLVNRLSKIVSSSRHLLQSSKSHATHLSIPGSAGSVAEV